MAAPFATVEAERDRELSAGGIVRVNS